MPWDRKAAPTGGRHSTRKGHAGGCPWLCKKAACHTVNTEKVQGSLRNRRGRTHCAYYAKFHLFFFFTGSISLELEHAPASKGLQYATGVECFPRCHGQPLNYTIIGMKRQHSFGCSTEIQQTQLHTGQMHNHQFMVLSPES